MRETQFIRQNAPKWQEFEEVLDGEQRDPDRLNELFIQITDDLSFSRTFYPNRSVRVYLNDLAQRIFLSIYRGQSTQKKGFAQFWWEELPLAMYAARRDMLIAFLVFAGAFLTGVLSSAMDPEFLELILGPSYVEMTKENIASGDPMAVYKQMGSFDMALGITANNLFVATLSFILGILFGIGSLMALIGNGVMIGAFQYFFIDQGLFRESFLAIWIHGTLEISAIVIAGGAGLTMGRGLAFPGTYTRGQAFQRSARRGLKILFGIAPLILLAGIFESYLTRHTDTPDLVRAAFILLCLAFVLVYFVWYPRFKAFRTPPSSSRDFDLSPSETRLPDLSLIRNAGQIFSDLFFFLQRSLPSVIGFSFLATLSFCLPAWIFSRQNPAELFRVKTGLFASMEALGQFYSGEPHIWMPWINIPILAFFSAVIFPKTMGKPTAPRKKILEQAGKTMIPATLFVLVLSTQGPYTNFLVLLSFPYLLVWMSVLALEPDVPLWGLRRSLFLLLPNFSRAFVLLLILMLTGGFFFTLLDTSLTWTYMNLISWVLRLERDLMERFSAIFLTSLTYFFQYLGFAMIATGFGLLYHTFVEIMEANGLRKKIRQIGHKRQIRGLEQEMPQ